LRFSASVYNLADGLQFIELADGKTVHCLFLGLFVGNRANLIEVCIMEEIFRGFWEISSQLFDKLTFILDEKTIILVSLSTKSAEISSPNRFSTGRTTSMPWV
jgi:hypothetical protein